MRDQNRLHVHQAPGEVYGQLSARGGADDQAATDTNNVASNYFGAPEVELEP